MQEKLSLAQQADAASADEMSLIAPGDYTQLTRNPNDYQDMSVSCSAQILYDPQYTDEGIYFVFRSASPKEDTPMLYGIAFWAGEEEDLRLRDRSFVTLHGTVIGEHSYTPGECVVRQGDKKYPWKENLDADYPQFSGSLQSDEKKHMVLTFSSLDASQDMVLTLYLTNVSGQRQSVEFSLSEISSEYLVTES